MSVAELILIEANLCESSKLDTENMLKKTCSLPPWANVQTDDKINYVTVESAECYRTAKKMIQKASSGRDGTG